MEVITSESLDTFVLTTVPCALKNMGAHFSPYGEAYIHGFLKRHLRSDSTSPDSASFLGLTDDELRTIRMTYDKSQRSSGKLLLLGEHCLLTAGFFPDFVESRHVPHNMHAYAQIGIAAYARAHDLFADNSPTPAASTPYLEVAVQFAPTARALQEVYNKSRVLFD